MWKTMWKVLKTVEELVMQGRELSQLTTDFTWYLRNIIITNRMKTKHLSTGRKKVDMV